MSKEKIVNRSQVEINKIEKMNASLISAFIISMFIECVSCVGYFARC